MKNIIKSITMLVLLTLSVSSCDDILETANLTDTFNDGSNFATFSVLGQNLGALATGEEFVFPINLELQGPTMHLMTDDITVTIDVNSGAAGNTAVEGVNYTFGSKTVVLTKAQNYIANVPITVLTAGVVAPLQLSLEVTITATTGNGNTVSSNHNSVLTFVYQCFADLGGTYLVTNDGCSPFTPFTTTIVPLGGAWRIAIGDGGFLGFGCTGNPGLNNGATIFELCGEILPTGDLDYGPCCNIGLITGGTWDSETGTLIMDHVQSFTGNWAPSWTSTYIRQ